MIDQSYGTRLAERLFISIVLADREHLSGALCDAALTAANVFQWNAVLRSEKLRYYTPLLVLIYISLFLHLVFGFAVIQMWRNKKQANTEPRAEFCDCDGCKSYNWYDQISIFITFLLSLLNVAISGFGLSEGYSS